MPYINSDGTVTENRSWLRPSIVSDIIWGVLNFVALFFTTALNPRAPVKKFVKNDNSKTSSVPGKSNNPLGRPNDSLGKLSNVRTLPKPCVGRT